MLRFPKAGVSMVELLVSLALLSFVLLAGVEFMIEGLKYYKNADFTLDLQRSTLVAVSDMSRLIGESNPGAYYVNNVTTGSPADLVGILAATPRDHTGSLVFSSKSGRLNYASLTCYWFDQPNSRIVRTQTFLDADPTLPDTDTTSDAFEEPPPIGLPSSGTWTGTPPGVEALISDFATHQHLINPLVPGGGDILTYEDKVVALFVKKLQVEVPTTNMGGEALGNDKPISVCITCGKTGSSTAGANAYEVTVNTTIYPKN